MAAKGKDAMGQRMKEYESVLEGHIDPSTPYVARLDGHGFSKFTKQFDKPFDDRFAAAMIATAEDLLSEFKPLTAYTQSDEITLVFKPVDPTVPGQTLPYNGRVMKTASLMAGFASARFNVHLTAQDWDRDGTNPTATDKVSCARAYFDCRLFNVPNWEEVVNNLLWRSVYDCRRNSISMLAQANIPHKKLQGKKKEELLDMLQELGINYDDMPPEFRFGTIIKKELREIDAVDGKTGEPVTTTRGVIVPRSFDLVTFSPEHVEMVQAKYWPDSPALASGADGASEGGDDDGDADNDDGGDGGEDAGGADE